MCGPWLGACPPSFAQEGGPGIPLWGAVPAWVRGWTLAPAFKDSECHLILLLSHPVPAQAHGSRLRLHQVSPADSGEYVCRVVSSSGPLETSVLVTIETSGSDTVLVPGEEPCSGAGKQEEGRKEGSRARSSGLHP